MLALPLAMLACGDGDTASSGAGGASSSAATVTTTTTTTATGSTTGTTTASSSSTTGSGGAPNADPCAGASDGAHCGSELGGLAEHTSLYACVGGATVTVSTCSLGCTDGKCDTPPADPCSGAQSGNGDYCGSGLPGGTPDALYTCANGSTATKVTCANGCIVEPPGTPDVCAPSGDPCANATSGNGKYCGSTIGGDPAKLYDCQNGVTGSASTCPNGCTIAPPGTPDHCASASNECCLGVPPGTLTQAYSACGNGGSHYGRDYGTPIGTPIYAGIAGTVVGSALGFPNCYSNGCSSTCWNAFNYVKIKSDCGDPADATHDLFVYYLHIDSLAQGIQNGSHVSKGQLVALSGNSGCSSGPHIHIETASVPANQSATLNTCASVDPATRYCN